MPTTASDAALDGVSATGATNSPLEQRERSADELILARARTAPSSGATAARSAPACRFGDLSAAASERMDGGAPPARELRAAPRRDGPQAHPRRAGDMRTAALRLDGAQAWSPTRRAGRARRAARPRSPRPPPIPPSLTPSCATPRALWQARRARTSWARSARCIRSRRPRRPTRASRSANVCVCVCVCVYVFASERIHLGSNS